MAKRAPSEITDLQIRNLKPKDKDYTFRLGKGLGLRIRTSGAKSWVYIYDFAGKRRLLTLGSYPEMKLADARAAWEEKSHEVRKGMDPASQVQTEKTQKKLAILEDQRQPTVEELANEYLERHAKATKRRWEEDERILKKEVIPAWGPVKAAGIRKRDVVAIIDGIVERGSPIMANRTLALIRKMFNFAVERDILAASPCAGVKAPAKENPRARVLSPDEIRAFWRSLDSSPMLVPCRIALKLLLVTGQRENEVLGLPWKEIDGDWWTLPARRSKNHQEHRIPLTGMALALLEETKTFYEGANSTYVFESPRRPGNPMTPTVLDNALRKCSFDFEHFTPHDLRRTMATQLGALGFSRLIQDKLLNHKDRGVAGIYDRHAYDTEKMMQAMAAWSVRLSEILGR